MGPEGRKLEGPELERPELERPELERRNLRDGTRETELEGSGDPAWDERIVEDGRMALN